jgi:hypothetical protein
MAKSVFVTTTERPPENEVIKGNDTLSIKKVSNTPSDDVAQMENATGTRIRTDKELEHAEQVILKNSTVKSTTAVGTGDDQSLIKVKSNEDAETLAALSEELELGEAAKDACPDALQCNWFDSLKLKFDIGLLNYRTKANSLIVPTKKPPPAQKAVVKKDRTKTDFSNMILSRLKASAFGNIVRCASYLAAVGLKQANRVAHLVAATGDPEMMGHLGESFKERYGERDADGNINPFNTGSKLVGLDGIMAETIGNSNGDRLTTGRLVSAFSSLSFNPKSLITPYQVVPPDSGTRETSTKHISYLSGYYQLQQNKNGLINVVRSSAPIDDSRMEIIAEAIGVQQIDLSLTNGAIMQINDGGVPGAVLNPVDMEIIEELEVSSLTEYAKTEAAGNTAELLATKRTAASLRGAINSGTPLTEAEAARMIPLLKQRHCPPQRMFGLDTTERTEIIVNKFRDKYARLNSRFA